MDELTKSPSSLGPIGPVFEYGDVILWERSIQVALKDFCKPGETVLDIGANIGGVSIALSRMVGSSGEVHAFECHPNLTEWCRQNIEINKANNIVLVEKAVYSTPDEEMTFYCEPSQFGHGSSLFEQQADSIQIKVKTTSVDEYCQALELKPSAMKIDVEGAEYDVLAGARKTLRKWQPVVVFEDIGNPRVGRDPMLLLDEMGYELYDASLYDRVDRKYYNDRPGVVNILAIPPKLQSVISYDKTLIQRHQNSCQLDLEAGRYVIECEILGNSTETAWIRLGNLATADDESMFETKLNWLKHHTSSCLVFDSPVPANLRLEIGSQFDIEGLGIGDVKVFSLNTNKNDEYRLQNNNPNHEDPIPKITDFPYATAMVPYYSVGRVLLPDLSTSGLVIPIDGEYVLKSPPSRAPYDWLVSQLACERDRFNKFSQNMRRYSDFSDVSDTQVDNVAPFLQNQFFSFGDALALTTILGEHKPKKLIEIGSGNSTRYALRAIRKYGLTTEITCIDPNPRADLTHVADRWIKQSVLDVGMHVFDELDSGDILMLDGSHLVLHGTDTTHVMLRIFPRLKDGVLMHLHDIHLPFEYPEVCDRLFWNEQYLLASLLMLHPPDKIVAPVKYMESEGLSEEGVSFWFEK